MLLGSTYDVVDLFRQGTKVETYGRTWYMGRVTVRDGWAHSRLGFASGTEFEMWDEDQQDFIDAEVNAGTTSPFVVRLEDLRVAFQLRGSAIKGQSFAHALQSLMREASGEQWRVELETTAISLPEWLSTVSRVTRISFTLRPPNPNFTNRPLIKNAVGDTEAAIARLVLEADPDSLDGLDTNAALITQALDHTDRGYGQVVSAAGEKMENGVAVPVEWRANGETTVAEAPVGESGEVSEDALRQTANDATET